MRSRARGSHVGPAHFPLPTGVVTAAGARRFARRRARTKEVALGPISEGSPKRAVEAVAGMSGRDLGAALLGLLDEDALAQFAERLRPHLEGHGHGHGHDVELLTPAEAAARLKLHPKTVVRMAREGRIVAVKIGTGWRFHPDRLDVTAGFRGTASGRCSLAPRRVGRAERPSVVAIRGGRPGSRGRSA
jgi:excisionase family DNA binding protein